MLQSKGHIVTTGNSEYVEINGTIYEGNIANGFDPYGYRLGLTSNCYTRSVDRKQLINDIQELIDNFPNIYWTAIADDDKHLFKGPQ